MLYTYNYINKIYQKQKSHRSMNRQQYAYYGPNNSSTTSKPNKHEEQKVSNTRSQQLQEQVIQKMNGWPTKVQKKFAPQYIIPQKISQSYEQYEQEIQNYQGFRLKKKHSQKFSLDNKYEQSQKQNTLIQQLYLSQNLDKSGIDSINMGHSPTNAQSKNQQSPFLLMKHILNQYTMILQQNKGIKSKMQKNQKLLSVLLQKNEILQIQNQSLRENVRNLQVKDIEKLEAININRQYLMKLEKSLLTNSNSQNGFNRPCDRCERNERNLQLLRKQFEIYKKDNQYMLRLIGEKCEIQQNKMMRFLQIIQEKDRDHKRIQNKRHNEQKDEQICSNLSIQSKSSAHNLASIQREQIFLKGQKQKLNASRIQNLNLPPATLKSVIINPTSSTTTCYMIDISERQTNLQYIGETGIWTHLLGRYRIDPNKIIQFVYKIKKSSTNSIGVGIVDKKYQKIRSCGRKQQNCIFYYGGSGRLWQSGQKLQKQGFGFNQGDTVIMIVLLCQGIIRWYVNGLLQAQYNSFTIIKDGRWKDVQWVPFVNISTSGDIVIWQVGE